LRDMGDSQTQSALSDQHSLIPTSRQKKARYGAPAFVAIAPRPQQSGRKNVRQKRQKRQKPCAASGRPFARKTPGGMDAMGSGLVAN